MKKSYDQYYDEAKKRSKRKLAPEQSTLQKDKKGSWKRMARKARERAEAKKKKFIEISNPDKFIGKVVAEMLKEVKWDSFEDVATPIIDKENKIVGFQYESDPDDNYQGTKYDDMGFGKFLGIDVWKI